MNIFNYELKIHQKTTFYILFLLSLTACFDDNKVEADNVEKNEAVKEAGNFVNTPGTELEAGYITEAYLRTAFTFSADDKIKYSVCKKERYISCTYVWGPKKATDEMRFKKGLAPSGNQLQIRYVSGRSHDDFQTVLQQYSDPEKVENLSQDAAWSKKRNQLTFIPNNNLMISILTYDQGATDSKSKAITIAHHLLEQL